MPRRDEFPDPPGATPLGLPLSDPGLHHDLAEPDPGEPAAVPPVADRDGRFIRIATTHPQARAYYGHPDGSSEFVNPPVQWHHLDFDWLAGEFSAAELTRLWLGSAVMNNLSERFDRDPLYTPLSRLGNSFWQYGRRRAGGDYARFVAAYRGIGRFDFGVAGFSSYYDHTTWVCSPRGRAYHAREDAVCKADGKTYRVGVWLDAHAAFQVTRGGQHVLTVGFAASEYGILVTQIQVRGRAKGNRWLYRLPRPLREHVLDRVRAAWPTLPVYLASGVGNLDYLRAIHGRSPEEFPPAVAERVVKFYDAPLAGYRRGDPVSVWTGSDPARTFRLVIPHGGGTPEAAPHEIAAAV